MINLEEIAQQNEATTLPIPKTNKLPFLTTYPQINKPIKITTSYSKTNCVIVNVIDFNNLADGYLSNPHNTLFHMMPTLYKSIKQSNPTKNDILYTKDVQVTRGDPDFKEIKHHFLANVITIDKNKHTSDQKAVMYYPNYIDTNSDIILPNELGKGDAKNYGYNRVHVIALPK